MKERQSTERFTNRVEAYVQSRPDYPTEVLDFLKSDLDLSSESIVADIGSGTGLLSKLFLENGNPVFGIEPNKEMRAAGEKLLSNYSNFTSIEGTAERTTLESGTVDFVVAGQAFHWFDLEKAKVEFKRVLKSEGCVVLLWNDRSLESPFSLAYEDFLKKFGIDYQVIDHRRIDQNLLSRFFGPEGVHFRAFKNLQIFDYGGLKARVLSSSYMPAENHPDFPAMISDLKKLFSHFEQKGVVTMEYDTKVYYGKL